MSQVRCPKGGSAPHEYEDAAAASTWGELQQGQLRVAVADGASEAMLAGRWANHLVEQFVQADWSTGFPGVVSGAAGTWRVVVDEYLRQRVADDRPIRWFEEPGLLRGSYATLLGLRIAGDDDGDDGEFEAVAVGDSCLFHVRDDALVAAFPLTDPAGFGVSPDLLSSNGDDPAVLAEHTMRTTGCWRSHDTIYLATDAVAHWLLTEVHEGGTPWPVLRELHSADPPDDAVETLQRLRDGGSMRNDDITIVRIDLR